MFRHRAVRLRNPFTWTRTRPSIVCRTERGAEPNNGNRSGGRNRNRCIRPNQDFLIGPGGSFRASVDP